MRNPKLVGRAPLADRLFIAGCTATYLVLAAAVVVALKAYGG
jgi:hypothetical protein